MSTRTPGVMYHLRQEPNTLFWQVVPLDRDQGERMRERKEPHVYDSPGEAYAVRRRLNLVRATARSITPDQLHIPFQNIAPERTELAREILDRFTQAPGQEPPAAFLSGLNLGPRGRRGGDQ